MSPSSRRSFLGKLCACVGGLVLAIPGSADAAGRYRAVCNHSPRGIWRGPIRSNFKSAEADRKQHARTCKYSDSAVAAPNDVLWD